MLHDLFPSEQHAKKLLWIVSLFENLKKFVSSSGRCPCKQVLPMISEKSLSFLLLINLSTAHCMLSLLPDGRELPSTALCLHWLSESTPPSHPFSFYYWFAAEKFQPLPGCCVLLQQMNTTAQKVILSGASLRCVHSLLSCVIEFFSKEWFVLTWAVVTFQSYLHPLHLGSSCLVTLPWSGPQQVHSWPPNYICTSFSPSTALPSLDVCSSLDCYVLRYKIVLLGHSISVSSLSFPFLCRWRLGVPWEPAMGPPFLSVFSPWVTAFIHTVSALINSLNQMHFLQMVLSNNLDRHFKFSCLKWFPFPLIETSFFSPSLINITINLHIFNVFMLKPCSFCLLAVYVICASPQSPVPLQSNCSYCLWL